MIFDVKTWHSTLEIVYSPYITDHVIQSMPVSIWDIKELLMKSQPYDNILKRLGRSVGRSFGIALCRNLSTRHLDEQNPMWMDRI